MIMDGVHDPSNGDFQYMSSPICSPSAKFQRGLSGNLLPITLEPDDLFHSFNVLPVTTKLGLNLEASIQADLYQSQTCCDLQDEGSHQEAIRDL